MKPNSIMVFAAGFGNRLGSLVSDRPKPMIEVGGRPLIDHAFDIVQEANITTCIVNVHYKAEVLKRHLSSREGVTVLHETPDILDTGGGLRHALPVLGPEPVFTLNTDVMWRGGNPLLQLAKKWNPELMDALLLLIPKAQAVGHSGIGDFRFADASRIRRCVKGEPGLLYAGTQITRTDELADIPDKAFSLNLLWDRMAKRERLFGLTYSGDWRDAGTPSGLESCEKFLAGTDARASLLNTVKQNDSEHNE